MKSTTTHKTPQSHHVGRQPASGPEPIKVKGLYLWLKSDAAKRLSSPFRRHGNLGARKKNI